jgi:hypothetical protein
MSIAPNSTSKKIGDTNANSTNAWLRWLQILLRAKRNADWASLMISLFTPFLSTGEQPLDNPNVFATGKLLPPGFATEIKMSLDAVLRPARSMA